MIRCALARKQAQKGYSYEQKIQTYALYEYLIVHYVTVLYSLSYVRVWVSCSCDLRPFSSSTEIYTPDL